MVRFGLPFIGVIGNNSHMNQIRYGQIMKYGAERGEVGNKLGDVHYSKFAEMLGGYGEEVREASQIRPALERARESGRSEEHTSELQSLMRISYAVFCLKKKNNTRTQSNTM